MTSSSLKTSITQTIPMITNDGEGASFFSSKTITLNGSSERYLSDQISAVNFRLRESDSTYASAWHVAGDPTLLIILSGTIRIVLRNGDYQEFSTGDMFVAEDYLAVGISFDETLHGHRADVMSNEKLSVLHLKLEKRT